MRVALVGPYPLDTSQFGGGVETSFFNLVDGLSAFDDVEPHVVTFARGAGEERRDDRGPAPALYLPGRARFNNLTLYRNDRRLLKRALDALEPDIVHAQDATSYGYVTLKVATGIPVVVSVHGIVREEVKHMKHALDRIRTSIADVAFEKYCIRNARYLVQPSRYPEDYFADEIRGKIVTVGNGISDRFFAAEPSPEPGRLLYTGVIMPRKRVLDLLDVFELVRRNVPGTKLRVAGPASDTEYIVAVHARIRELGLAEDVEFLGSLSPEELLDEYRRASLFVLASGEENSPMVIGEAMAVGVPVVATRAGGIRYLVEDGRTGFLADVGDVSKLAARTSQLLLDDGLRAAFAAAARTVALERFRSVDVAARVRDVYLQVLRESGRT